MDTSVKEIPDNQTKQKRKSINFDTFEGLFQALDCLTVQIQNKENRAGTETTFQFLHFGYVFSTVIAALMVKLFTLILRSVSVF